jgi:galactokinase
MIVSFWIQKKGFYDGGFMMQIETYLLKMDSTDGKNYLGELYGHNTELVELQKERYMNLITAYQKRFQERDVEIFSSPGRTEIIGNHTDHNHGMVLAASVTLDCIGVASKNHENIIRIHDISYKKDYIINLSETQKKEGEEASLSLIRGILAGFLKFGYFVGGFNLCITSNVISAAGVSSSASFEMLICKILDTFYNHSTLQKINYAKIGQYAENIYWEKQSGLMDQMACAIGGVLSIDFKDRKNPKVEKIPFELSSQGYELLLVNTGGNHADLSLEYSAIPFEMKSVAKEMGEAYLSEVPYEQFIQNLENLRLKVGDRAILRCFHFYEEKKRVLKSVDALKENNFENFLTLITASGNSSWKFLQNCYTTKDPKEQSTAYYLTLSELFLRERNIGACRVHGGGFAGTIVVYLPAQSIHEYVLYMEKLTGTRSIYKMNIRKYGVVSFHEILK